MTTSPLVSVIIPVYNCEKYIQACLKSVLQQSYQNIEIIVVNDGSQDQSIELVKQFKDPRIAVVHKQNGGLSSARNAGISASHGDLLALLDADDLWLPHKLEAHVLHFSQNQSLGLSFDYSFLINENDAPLGLLQIGKTQDITASDIYLKNPIGNGSSVVIRRELVEAVAEINPSKTQINLFNPDLRQSEDIECWMKIALKTSWTITGIPFVLTGYRVNQGGLSANLMKQYQSWHHVSDLIANYAPMFIRTHQRDAEAFYLRYLARRAISQHSKKVALHFLQACLRKKPKIIIVDPLRTIVTMIAIVSDFILPTKAYDSLQAWAMKRTGRSQWKRVVKRQKQYTSYPKRLLMSQKALQYQ